MWLTSVGAGTLVIGMVASSVSSIGISANIRREIAKVGAGSIATPSGYIAFVFIIIILVVSLYACAQVAAARQEESDQRAETLLALPVGRYAWLGGRLLLAAGGVAALAAVAGLLTWAGAVSQGVSISLPRMLEAAANCLPVALLFLGIAALAYALVPRAGTAIAYGLVAVSFLWDLTGSLLGVPKWLVDLTPFAHVGLVPAEPFRAGAAAAMLAIGVLAGLGALAAFRRRDLLGAEGRARRHTTGLGPACSCSMHLSSAAVVRCSTGAGAAMCSVWVGQSNHCATDRCSATATPSADGCST